VRTIHTTDSLRLKRLDRFSITHHSDSSEPRTWKFLCTKTIASTPTPGSDPKDIAQNPGRTIGKTNMVFKWPVPFNPILFFLWIVADPSEYLFSSLPLLPPWNALQPYTWTRPSNYCLSNDLHFPNGALLFIKGYKRGTQHHRSPTTQAVAHSSL
jgi:hypothetical protein